MIMLETLEMDVQNLFWRNPQLLAERVILPLITFSARKSYSAGKHTLWNYTDDLNKVHNNTISWRD